MKKGYKLCRLISKVYWVTNSTTFQIDIDECAAGTANCLGNCDNTVGGFCCSGNDAY